jgi:Domain of unknown function (DUF4913)
MTSEITPPTSSEELSEPLFPDVVSWVNCHFVPMYRRTLGGEFRWCAQWWRHAEALSRFTALWHSWEAMRLQPAIGIGRWYREHLDHQLPVLLGPRGPFYQCTETEHIEPRQAAVSPAPPELWDYEAFSID